MGLPIPHPIRFSLAEETPSMQVMYGTGATFCRI